MVTSNCDNAINYKSTDSQKECCAVIAMREAVETLAHEKIFHTRKLFFVSQVLVRMKPSLILTQRFGKKALIIC